MQSVEYIECQDIPALSWLCFHPVSGSKGATKVVHGKYVEVRSDWFFEGVWEGEFEKSDFDQSAHVFGTGIRFREDHTTVVTSSSSVDRVWITLEKGVYVISNSLPLVLSVTNTTLDPEYLKYPAFFQSIVRGLKAYQRILPNINQTIRLVYYENIELRHDKVAIVRKNFSGASFHDYGSYRASMVGILRNLMANANDSGRKEKYQSITTLSRGYDSPAVSVLAREVGCRQAVTLNRARSYFRVNDSGMDIARLLDMDCKEYPREKRLFRDEEFFWVVLGLPQDLNVSIFDFPKPLCILFSGFNGDKVWDCHGSQELALLERTDSTGLGLCEFRLVEGVCHVPVPFFQIEAYPEILRIGNSEEMKPWVLGSDYDRPIPRRIIEEAGVPRSQFAQRKSATSIDDVFVWPFSSWAKKSYEEFLRRNIGFGAKDKFVKRLVPGTNYFDRIFLSRLRSYLGVKDSPHSWLSCYQEFPHFYRTFQWSNEVLKSRYEKVLKKMRLIGV